MVEPYEIQEYVGPEGKNPFRDWFDKLGHQSMVRVTARIQRMRLGNLGDNRHLGKGLAEARIDLGPGYRIYYGIAAGRLILLVGGGDKSSQSRDISKAFRHWQKYLEDHS